MNITTEQYELLKQFERHLETAVHCNYVRTVTMKDAQTMNALAKQLLNKTYNLSCPKCVFNMCKDLGNVYFNFKTT